LSVRLTLVGVLLVYILVYKYYSGYLARRVFSLDDRRITPAYTERDDQDFVPAPRLILFGHHFASITGLSPMLGPAIAVIWGWFPALLWVCLGALLIGCVHDFAALVMSMRAKGVSIGTLAETFVGKLGRILFLILIFFLASLAMGVFVLVIAKLFTAGASYDPATSNSYPTAVLPSLGILLLALVFGVLTHIRGANIYLLGGIGFLLSVFFVWSAVEIFPIPTLGADHWKIILLFYGLLASSLPVWLLLQPRDFINSLLLYFGLSLMFAGVFFFDGTFSAPAFNPNPEGAPPIFPFVFIVIACGAVSGFHSIVSSGTTAKQIKKEKDARSIGYGGMLGESLLGLMAVLACAGGLSTVEWNIVYTDWDSAAGLDAKLGAFISGSATFITSLPFGISMPFARNLVAVVAVSFALTTLDSATRLLRYNIQELGSSIKSTKLGQTSGFRVFLSLLANKYAASLLAVMAIGYFAFYEIDAKPAGLSLWELFGITNQLLAALALLVATLYLLTRKKNFWVTLIPMVFMFATTLSALLSKMASFLEAGKLLLGVVSVCLLLITLVLLFLSIQAVRKTKSGGILPPEIILS